MRASTARSPRFPREPPRTWSSEADGGTFQADADVDGAFVLDRIPAGNYEVKVTIDTPSADANLGTARTTHRSPVKLVAGDNQVTVPTH